VVNNLTAVAVTAGQVRLESDGSPWRPLVHVEDISRAFLAVLEAPRELVHDQAFNVGRPQNNVQVRDVAEMVRDAVPAGWAKPGSLLAWLPAFARLWRRRAWRGSRDR
jgi:nucleoside-diphosphate-sugar epimerase